MFNFYCVYKTNKCYQCYELLRMNYGMLDIMMMRSKMIGSEMGLWVWYGLRIRSVIDFDMNYCRHFGCSKYKGNSAEILVES